MLNYISPGVLIISAVSLAMLLIGETKAMKGLKLSKIIPGPFVAVAVGIILNNIFQGNPDLAIAKEHLVNVPVPDSVEGFLGNFTLPDFSALANPQVYFTAVIIIMDRPLANT